MTTLKDISKVCGVTPMTVSKVLNGKAGGASQAMRQRILAVAEELRYSPNIIARGLKSQRHYVLGVTFHYPDPTWIMSDYYGTSVLTGIMHGAHKSGYNTLMFHKPWYSSKESAAGFRGQGVDGFLIVAPKAESDMVSGLAALDIPLVVISGSCDRYGVPSVDIDNAKGVRLGLEHLLALGHRRFAHIINEDTLYDNERRRDFFLEFLAESGISVPPEYMKTVAPENAGSRTVHEATKALLSLPTPPTAVFATDDSVAMTAMDAANELGIVIPEQFSIIGFDDHPETKRMTPPLTTVRQPLLEMGETAAGMLISLIEGQSVPPRTRIFEPELIVRGSTGPVLR